MCDYDKLKNDIMKERDTNKSLHHELANAINRQNDLLKHIAILEDKRHMVTEKRREEIIGYKRERRGSSKRRVGIGERGRERIKNIRV